MAEFTAPIGPGGFLQTPDVDWAAATVIPTGAIVSAQSQPINARVVLVVGDVPLWLAAGADPVAWVGPGSFYLPADTIWVLPFVPGHRLSAIDTPGGPSGHLAILPCVNPE